MIQRPKGTLDVYGTDGTIYNYIYNSAQEIMSDYNFEFIKIPTFEETSLFYRGVGEGTDIVNKETYDFVDKGERKMTLRPEFTAGVIRSYIENKMYADNSVKKLWYFGSAFRYERPQSGRYREFTQFGVEVLGVRNAFMDAEVISLAYRFLSGLGITNMKVKLNTLGDKESRQNYRDVLYDYLKKDYDSLCDTCKDRLERNPLRILDCKYDNERDYIKNAPKTLGYLNDESKKYFDEVKEALECLDIPYIVDSSLVRGLDYYSDTVFEIICDYEELGKANTICAGGRYDGLVELLDGPKTPGIGFAMGLERIIIMLKEMEAFVPSERLHSFVMNLDGSSLAYQIVDDLRSSGFSCEIDYTGKTMKGLWKLVDKYNPTYVIIIGEDEVKGDYVTVKDNDTKEEIKVKISELLDYFNMNL